MKEEKQQSFTSVISVDPYNHEYYKSTASHLSKESAPKYLKTQYAISYIGTKSFISAMISVSKNIPDDDLPDIIENKVYEELALDMAISYEVRYIEAYNNVDESNRFFHVFVVDPLTLEEEYKDVVDEIKYIDKIVPLPLLLKGLYTKEIIDDAGVHCFIYFQQNDTFLTIYNENEFVYTKSLKYSLNELHTRFCELLGEQIPKDIFFQILSEEGLATTNKEYQKHFIKLFAEVFLHISDVLTYAKRAYDIEKIEHIFIGSEISTIAGIDEYSQTYLATKSSEFNFNYGFTTEEPYMDQLHALMQLYTTIPDDQRYECNFSIFHRPPPFIRRSSGQLILLSIASVTLALIYPIMNWSLGYAESLHYSLLQTEYNEVHNTRTTREATLKLKNAHKAEAEKLKNTEIAEYTNKKNTLIKIRDVKVNYPMKAKNLTELTKDLNKFSIKLTDINYHQDKGEKAFTFTLISTTDKQITALVEYLTKYKTGQYKFSLEDIDFDEQSNRYVSELKVKLL